MLFNSSDYLLNARALRLVQVSDSSYHLRFRMFLKSCPSGVYANLTRQLDTICVKLGSIPYLLDISCKWSRVYLDILREIEMMAAKRHEKRVGYIRVSAIDQNTERQ